MLYPLQGGFQHQKIWNSKIWGCDWCKSIRNYVICKSPVECPRNHQNAVFLFDGVPIEPVLQWLLRSFVDPGMPIIFEGAIQNTTGDCLLHGHFTTKTWDFDGWLVAGAYLRAWCIRNTNVSIPWDPMGSLFHDKITFLWRWSILKYESMICIHLYTCTTTHNHPIDNPAKNPMIIPRRLVILWMEEILHHLIV